MRISIGVATLIAGSGAELLAVTGLIRSADHALCAAKAAGRDTVIAASAWGVQSRRVMACHSGHRRGSRYGPQRSEASVAELTKSTWEIWNHVGMSHRTAESVYGAVHPDYRHEVANKIGKRPKLSSSKDRNC